MKTLHRLALASGLAFGIFAVNSTRAGTVIVSDNFNVTGSGSGFALNTGVNTGINPPTTRLTGTAASGLRYINTGTKATTAYTITSSKLKVTSAANPGRFTFSSNGTTAFDFAPALGLSAATPATPVVYDLSISMDNDSTGTQRFSFALGTAEGDATTWDFGFQVYRAASADTFYTIGKRIDTGSSGLASDLNASILTMAAGTYGTEITILMRVTDAGSETTTFNSRVQLSLNGGSTWFYDTDTDANLTSGFRFNGAARVVMCDVAPDAGNVTYDNLSLTWVSGPRAWTGGGTTGNWSNTANWGGVAPSSGNPLIFTGTTRQVNTNDLTGLNIPWLNFNNGGFSIYGNTWTNSGAITNFSGINTLFGPLSWSSTNPKTWSIASGSELILNNNNSVEVVGDHTIVGGGTLRLKTAMDIGSVTTANPAFSVNEGKHIVDGGTFSSRGGYRIGSLATRTGAQTILTNGASLTITAGGGGLRVGDSANPNASRLDMDNSTLSLVGGAHLSLPYATGSIGIINQVGGTVTPGIILFNDVGAGTGSYTIKNGTLVTKQIRKNIAGGSSSIYFDNATVRTDPAALSAFMNALDLAQINSGGLTLDVLNDIVVDQTLSGTGALTKTGSAMLTLNTNNSFSGGVTLSAGTLGVGNNSAFGTGTFTVNGGTVIGSGGTRTLGNPVAVGADFAVGGTVAVTFTGGVNLGSSTRVIATTSSGTTTLSGVVSGTGGLTKDGTGVMQLSGSSANTYSGSTLVNAGTLLLAKTAGVNAVAGAVTVGDGAGGAGTDILRLSAANQIDDTAAVTISGSGLLDLNGFSETVQSVSSSAATSQIALGAGTLTIGDSSSATYAGSISGTGTLVKQGSGTLTLSGASTYTGATTVSGGVVNVQNGAALGSGTTTVNGGTALEVQGGIAVANQTLTVNGDGIGSAGALRNINGNNSWSGAITLGSASRINSDSGTLTLSGTLGGSGQSATFGGAGNTTVSGAITSGTVTKEGTGTLTLSGANTYTGATVISSGTLALGVGGSLASSTISLASNATYNVSAISGYALTASQTLSRNSTSGAGNVTGSVTFNSGAKVSPMIDGTTDSVGTINIAGNITLNANVITINVTGNPLDIGTYSLITYTGTKSGSFNVTPTFTGSGLGMGLTAKIVESAGLISVKVSVPPHGIAAANVKVVENDLANTTNSVDVSATVAINGFQIRDGSSRGDYTVQIGTSGTDDLANGALIASIAENGRDNGEEVGTAYCTASISSTSSGYFIPTASAPDGKEYNINVSSAYFPYAKFLGGYARNSAGTAGGPNDLLTASPGLVLGTHFVDNGGGLSTVNLTSLGINSQTDGVLLVTAGANNNEYASSKANTNGTWTVYVKDNGTNGNVTTQGPVAFVFVPKTNVSVISGKFSGDSSILMYNGSAPRFSVTTITNGTWKLTIPGYSSSKGVLVISGDGGGGNNGDNIVSAQPSGSDWIIEGRDLPGLGLQATTDPVVSFIFIPAPTATLVSPANDSTISSAPTLKVTANNTAGGNLTVTFYGHRATIPGPGPDFLIPVLPDTQNYAREDSSSGQATMEMWLAQTDWIIAHRFTDNIPFVATLGDCVNTGDALWQWKNATNAYYRLEEQSLTQLLDGIPYGVTVGNHDQAPNGDPDGDTSLYNQFFGSTHFNSKSYYGGHYSTNNDSWWDTFSAGGMDFLVISFEYGRYGQTILDWANDTIANHPNHRVIVLTHHAGDDTPDDTTVAPFSAQGSAIYNALKVNANFFMMLGGHVFNEGGEGRRSDTYNGHTVRTMISDYQGRFNGGNGLMRLLYFSPANNLISVKTYSPYTGNYETDANSQFTYSYNMQPNGAGSPATAYIALKTNVVAAGSQSSNVWSGLVASKPYEWYVTVMDEAGDYSTSPVWSFKTASNFARPALVDANRDGIADDWETQYGVTDANADDDDDGQNNYAEYVAKTNPKNPNSLLRIVEAKQASDGSVTLKWSSVGGARYRIQYADGIDGDFNDITRDENDETDQNLSGVESTQSYTDPDATLNGVRFYRIKVVP